MEGRSHGDFTTVPLMWVDYVVDKQDPLGTVNWVQTFNETAALDHQNRRPFSCLIQLPHFKHYLFTYQ